MTTQKLIMPCILAAAVLVAADAFSQTSQPAPQTAQTPTALPKAPKLSPEQRMKFAQARDLVMQDPQYAEAVRKAAEAQKAVDRIFFAKLLKSSPDLKDYILYLEKARGVTRPTQP